MTVRNEATEAPKTLLGLGPPDPPEKSFEVALEKTDAKDAPIETVRAWSTSGRDYGALTERTLADDHDEMLPFGVRDAPRGRAFIALGAIAFFAALAMAFTLQGRSAPRRSPHATAKPTAKITAIVGGPWVLRTLEDDSEEPANAVPPYLRRTRASSVHTVPRVPFPSTTRTAATSAPRVESGAPRARVISEPASGATMGNPDRIQAVADTVRLEDEESASESATGEADNP